MDDKKYLIVDTDAGTDDAWALLMLLKAEIYQNYKIIGITCVNGNTNLENVAINVMRVLELVKRTDVPVFKGAFEPIISPFEKCTFFGEDGFCDVISSIPDLSLIKSENAINAIYKLTKERPKQVTLVCLGPLTNIALALKTYSDIADNIQEIFLMGGNGLGIGNKTSSAEFNFYADPEAAYIVLRKATCPITILPWEACMIENLKLSLEWRYNVLGKMNNAKLDLLNLVDKAKFTNESMEWIPCDALLTAVLLKKEKIIKKSKQCHASVELNGTSTRGQMVIDHLKRNKNNITLIQELDSEECKNMLMWTVDGID